MCYLLYKVLSQWSCILRSCVDQIAIPLYKVPLWKIPYRIMKSFIVVKAGTQSEGSNLGTIPLYFAFACVLLSITFYFSYLCGCSSSLTSLLAYHPSFSLLVNTHLNKEGIEHINLLFRGIKEEKFQSPSSGIRLQFLFLSDHLHNSS